MNALIALSLLLASAQDPKDAEKIVKDRSSFLRTAQKPFATFAGAGNGEVRLRLEPGSEEKTWPVDPEAEVRVHGGWGRLEDLVPGERVWVWLRVDRAGKPRAVFLIADEISEQDIHQVPYAVAAVDAEKREVVVKRKLDRKNEEVRRLRAEAALDLSSVKPEAAVYLQTAGPEVRRIVDAEGLAALKAAQRVRLEARFRKEGLPGTVGAVHALVGEAEVVLDHEAMRWARALKAGDVVTLNLEPPVRAAVLEVRAWNERTRVALAGEGRAFGELSTGRRVRVAVPEPAAEALASREPPDAGRPRAERVEWFLSSTYCSCSIAGDV